MGDRIVAHEQAAEAAPKRKRKSGKSGWQSWREKKEAAEIRLGLEKAHADKELVFAEGEDRSTLSVARTCVQDSASASLRCAHTFKV